MEEGEGKGGVEEKDRVWDNLGKDLSSLAAHNTRGDSWYKVYRNKHAELPGA